MTRNAHDLHQAAGRRGLAMARAAACLLVLGGGLAACAPQQTGTTYSSGAVGRAASVSYGTIVGLRPVHVQGGGSGVGTAAGAIAGGVGGSFIGGDWRSNALAGLGGAILGGLAGNAIGGGVSGGNAVEYFIREDNGGDISVVQTGEEGLQAGDRVVIVRGDRTRISRAAGGPPQGAYVPPPPPHGATHHDQPYSGRPYSGQPYSGHPQGVPVYTAPARY
ncbi:outer membrane lipoprotein [Teichococcus oryzae]|uniref:glycine zipper 2TM domain-containing protein n=1 Tax=Teichococcus oryzae TaxID=1608942 RepID=UPI001883E7AD|nr:glycine zipper 2TM domain-containing protein [Pseudoroseomonas oryzae]